MGGRTHGVRGQQDSSLEARYERALAKLIPSYMDRHRLTRTGLAEALGVNRSTLSRFLNRTNGYTPEQGRPEIVRILEQVEAVCHRQNMHARLDPDAWTKASTATDVEIWFGNYMHRLNYLVEEVDPVTGLVLLPELVAQAVSAPPVFSASMSVNLLLRIGFLVDRPEAVDASRILLSRTVDRVRMLETRLVELVSAGARDASDIRPIASVPHRPPGYAGYALAWLGIRLVDDDLIAEGLSKQTRAALMPHEPEDGHWANLLMCIEELLSGNHPRARELSESIAASVSQPSPELTGVLQGREYALTLSHWRKVAPGLFPASESRDAD